MTKRMPVAELVRTDDGVIVQVLERILPPVFAGRIDPVLEIARVSLEAERDGNSVRCILIRLRLKDPRVQRVPTPWRKA